MSTENDVYWKRHVLKATCTENVFFLYDLGATAVFFLCARGAGTLPENDFFTTRKKKELDISFGTVQFLSPDSIF